MSDSKSRKNRKWIWIIIFLFLFFTHPWVYIGLPISGVIIDFATKKPLEGVHILANWDLLGTTLMDEYQLGQINIAEAITNAKGEYRFPFWVKVPIHGSMKLSSPVLTYYKNEYHVVTKLEALRSEGPILFSSSSNDGKIIQLESFKGNLVDYAEHLSATIVYKIKRIDEYKSMGMRHSHRSCVLSNLPLLLNSVSRRQKTLNQAGIEMEFLSPEQVHHLETNCDTKVIL